MVRTLETVWRKLGVENTNASMTRGKQMGVCASVELEISLYACTRKLHLGLLDIHTDSQE